MPFFHISTPLPLTMVSRASSPRPAHLASPAEHETRAGLVLVAELSPSWCQVFPHETAFAGQLILACPDTIGLGVFSTVLFSQTCQKFPGSTGGLGIFLMILLEKGVLIMTTVPGADGARMLGIHPKTFFPDLAIIIGFQVLMVWLYQHNLPYLPVGGWDSWQSRIGPVLITGTTGVGYFSRLTKTSLLEVLGQDYVRTARSKVLFERIVISRHALRNALLPLVTVIGPSLAFIVTGVFLTEQLFNIPGVSSITLDAIFQQDFPILQATTVLTCTSVVIFNMLTDIAYAIVDPRIRVE